MYQAHFGLTRRPFEGGIAQDAAVYRGPREQRLLAAVRVALTTADSAIVLTGPAGVGKTTLMSAALRATSTRLALGWINSQPGSPAELLELLLTEFGCNAQRAGRVERLQMWRQFLNEMNATDSRVFVIAERADDLPVELLRTLDSLTAGDPNGSLGANLVLLGEPPFNDTLKAPPLAALRQRIRLRTQLEPFDVNELRGYLTHQLASAGGTLERVFTADAIQALHRFSGGSARLANNLCESALTLAVTQGEPLVTGERVLQTAVELFGLAPHSEPIADATAPVPAAALSASAAASSTAAASTSSSIGGTAPAAAPPTRNADAPSTAAARASVPPPMMARGSPQTAAPKAHERPAQVRATIPPPAALGRSANAPPAAPPSEPVVAEADGIDDSFAITTLVDIPEVPMPDLPVLTDAVEAASAQPPAPPRQPPAPTPASARVAPPAPAAPAAAPRRLATPERAAEPSVPAAAQPLRRSISAIERPAFLAPGSSGAQRPATPTPEAAAPTAPRRAALEPQPRSAADEPPDDQQRRTQTMRALSVAKSINEVSDSMAETLFGEADLDMLSTALATAGWPEKAAESGSPQKPTATPPKDPAPEDPFDWFLAPDAPLELIDDSEPPPSDPKPKVAARS